MPLAAGKPHHLVFNAGAVAGTDALNLPGIQRRAVQVGPDNLVHLLIGVRDMTGLVGRMEGQRRAEGEGRWLGVAAGRRCLFPVNGIAVQPGTRSGLKPPGAETDRR